MGISRRKDIIINEAYIKIPPLLETLDDNTIDSAYLQEILFRHFF